MLMQPSTKVVRAKPHSQMVLDWRSSSSRLDLDGKRQAGTLLRRVGREFQTRLHAPRDRISSVKLGRLVSRLLREGSRVRAIGHASFQLSWIWLGFGAGHLASESNAIVQDQEGDERVIEFPSDRE